MIIEHVLVLSAYLFSIGINELITSRNMVRDLMCLELKLNAFTSIGLAIVLSIYHSRKSTRINQLNLLNN
ncbi:unnamed protein product [Withania somnifera]